MGRNSIVRGDRRRRYIGFLISTSVDRSPFTESELLKDLRVNCKNFLNKDYRDMGLRLIRFDGEKGIMRCNHVEKDDTIKLLRSIKSISSRKAEIETLGTSGTIKSLVSKYMNK